MSWYSGLEDVCQRDVPLRTYTWYGLGGPARWFFTPRDEAQLAAVLQRCAAHGVPWRLLGCGANVLVRDEGVEGAVIHLTGEVWEAVRFNDPCVHAGAGANFPRLAKKTVERGLSGLENLAGIPGSLGGVIRMNAGGRYGNIAQYVRQVRLMCPDGMIAERTADQMGFGYRTSKLDGQIVLAVTLVLQPGDRAAALERFRRIWNEKYASQPPVSAKSAGCVFKNPPGQAAGALIDRAGLKGARCGGAEISMKHANFIVAYEGATAQNVLELVALARERVRAQSGLELELEMEVW